MIYRTEHPKPQFERENWLNLNGIWQFEIDNGNSGDERGLHKNETVLQNKINIPFCPESKLSGIENVDFMNAVWYKRTVTITKEQLNNLVFLHFGAVDYETSVFINGKKCGTHKGGYTSFQFDITEYLVAGENVITVKAVDDVRSRLTPSGKQSKKYNSYGCHYTRTTGIWQTVWLEFVPKTHIVKVKYATDTENATLNITAFLNGSATLTAEAFFAGESVGISKAKAYGGVINLVLPLKEKHLWQVGKGNLYDLKLTYGDDEVRSYFGLRDITIQGRKVLINGKSVFQRLILDQGFYPEGIYTAPDDSELLADIERSMAMGFNGARLHEKVFEERFLYHCDRLGYIVWGEYPNWGIDHTYADSVYGFLPEWLEAVERDYNHPAIIGWCPFNETWDINGRKQFDDLLAVVYKATKAADSTRPVISSSGGYHVIGDIFDAHNYQQNPGEFSEYFKDFHEKGIFSDKMRTDFKDRQTYDGKIPFFISEYGGIGWSLNSNDSWGYGNAPKTEEEFLERLKGLTDVLLDNPSMFGLCYTQLTDVEQEQNGLYTYDRRPKFPPEVINKIFSRKAAIED